MQTFSFDTGKREYYYDTENTKPNFPIYTNQLRTVLVETEVDSGSLFSGKQVNIINSQSNREFRSTLQNTIVKQKLSHHFEND